MGDCSRAASSAAMMSSSGTWSSRRVICPCTRSRSATMRARSARSASCSARWALERRPRRGRSEEHTSELSHVAISYAVFCLKKKTELGLQDITNRDQTKRSLRRFQEAEKRLDYLVVSYKQTQTGCKGSVVWPEEV